MSKLDELSTEDLIKLLNESPSKIDNHPFSNFLDALKITKGINLVEFNLLLQLYKCHKYKMKGLSRAKIIKACKHKVDIIRIQNIFYFNINYTEKEIKSKIYRITPKKKINVDRRLKNKFDLFLKYHRQSIRGISFKEAFYIYIRWAKVTNKSNPFTEEQFLNMCKLYFSYYR